MMSTAVTIDTSVWVSAAEATDKFHAESRALMKQVVENGCAVNVPAYARLEIACALSRRLRDAGSGRRLASEGLAALNAMEVPIDDKLLDEAFDSGTGAFLRGADALFTAAAHLTGSTLISWDEEHINRGGAITPAAWLASLAPSPP